MPKRKLTKKWIDKEPLGKDTVWWDTETQGLRLRITETKKVLLFRPEWTDGPGKSHSGSMGI